MARTDRGKVSDVYQWSVDNSAEIKRGWIKAADSLVELASSINLRPEQLQSTIAQYNLLCVAGYDPEFGRSPNTLFPIATPPFYAIPMWPCLYNTQGGPKRNAHAQVLDLWENRSNAYTAPGSWDPFGIETTRAEEMSAKRSAFGRIAGKNAAGEVPLPSE